MAPRIGTGRGGLHIGFINLLLSTDLQVDVVAGCSVLALVCAPDDSGNFASLKRWGRLFNDCNLLRLIDVYMQRDDLLLGNRIFAQITQLLRLKHIEVLALPICIRVTNHATGRKLRLIQADFHLVVRYCYSMTSSPSPISYYGYWLLGGAVGSTVTIIVGRALIVDIVTASSSQHEAQVMPRSLLSLKPCPVPEKKCNQWEERFSKHFARFTLCKLKQSFGVFKILTACFPVLVERLKRTHIVGYISDGLKQTFSQRRLRLDFYRADQTLATVTLAAEKRGKNIFPCLVTVNSAAG